MVIGQRTQNILAGMNQWEYMQKLKQQLDKLSREYPENAPEHVEKEFLELTQKLNLATSRWKECVEMI
jgi:hypothetical protein